MQALKAAVCIPLLASGTLVGILNLGERVTGSEYTQDELEILYSLASHIAVVIQDINLHQEVQAQKVFTVTGIGGGAAESIKILGDGDLATPSRGSVIAANRTGRGSVLLRARSVDVVQGQVAGGDIRIETLALVVDGGGDDFLGTLTGITVAGPRSGVLGQETPADAGLVITGLRKR